MYRIVKVLNNNGVLAFHSETRRELILLGSGIGFGRRVGEQLEHIGGARVYSLVSRNKNQSAVKVAGSIEPVFLEISGKIIEAARAVFDSVSSEILLPLADHIALAVKRAKENKQLPNPFTPDIRVLFPEEYRVAKSAGKIIREMTGAKVSEDEVGFITLHIHSARTDELVSETLETTRVINASIGMLDAGFPNGLSKDSLGYSRLVSHLYYMIARTRKGETCNVDLNDFVYLKYPRAAQAAKEICSFMSSALKCPVAEEEIGFLAIHIQRTILSE